MYLKSFVFCLKTGPDMYTLGSISAALPGFPKQRLVIEPTYACAVQSLFLGWGTRLVFLRLFQPENACKMLLYFQR